MLLLQQCPACLLRLIWMILEMGRKWPYSCCLVERCFHDLFSIARSILEQLPSSFFSIRFVSVHKVHLYSSIDTTAAWNESCFISSDITDLHMINNLSIGAYWCHFQSMRRWCRGTWTCTLISENRHFEWRWFLLD